MFVPVGNSQRSEIGSAETFRQIVFGWYPVETREKEIVLER